MKNIIDSIYYNIGNFVYLGAQLLISIVLVRLGGFEDAGYFSLIMTINNVVVIISHFSMRTLQVSDLKNKFSDETYIVSRLVTIGIAIVSCAIYCVIMGYTSGIIVVVLVYTLYKSIESYSDVLSGIWQKNGNMKDVGLSLSIKGVVNFISFLVAYILSESLLISITAMMTSSFLVLILFDFKKTKLYLNQWNIFRKQDLNKALLLIKMGFWTMLSTMFVAIFNGVPKIIIEKFYDAELLGVFSSVSAPTVVISTFAVGILLPIAPKMAEHYHTGEVKKLIKLICVCNVIVIGIGVLATAFSVVAGKVVFELLFGEEILTYFSLFYWMIWVSVLIAMVNSYTTVLIATRKLKQLLFFSAIACVLEWVLCIVFIPEKGIYGAAYAMLLALAIQFVTETLYIIYLLNKRKKVV